MYEFRNSYNTLARILCFLFAVHFFNFSIDPKDREPDFAPEDLSLNEIESIAEFMAEVVFGLDNTFEEHDEADANGGTIDFCKIFFVSQESLHLISKTFVTLQAKYFIHNIAHFPLLAREISSPPPKA